MTAASGWAWAPIGAGVFLALMLLAVAVGSLIDAGSAEPPPAGDPTGCRDQARARRLNRLRIVGDDQEVGS